MYLEGGIFRGNVGAGSGELWGSLGVSLPREEEEEGGRGKVRGVQGIPGLSAPALPWNEQKTGTSPEHQTPRVG